MWARHMRARGAPSCGWCGSNYRSDVHLGLVMDYFIWPSLYVRVYRWPTTFLFLFACPRKTPVKWHASLGVKADKMLAVKTLFCCSDDEKPGSVITNWSFIVVATKNAQSNRIYVSVGIVGLSHVRARQCTSTPSLREGWVFGSRDAWFHVPMLLNADTMNICRQRTR